MFILSKSESLNIDLHNVMIKKNNEQLKDFVLGFEKSDDINISIIYSDKQEDTIIKIGQLFKFIEAAGGIVKNNKGELLIIERLGKNDLPKGKVENGEKVEDAAKREIEEECGINKLETIQLLEPTYHTYRLNGKFIFKKTNWYYFLHNGNDKPIPQTEENITKVEWCNDDNIRSILGNTYNSIIDVFSQLNYII